MLPGTTNDDVLKDQDETFEIANSDWITNLTSITNQFIDHDLKKNINEHGVYKSLFNTSPKALPSYGDFLNYDVELRANNLMGPLNLGDHQTDQPSHSAAVEETPAALEDTPILSYPMNPPVKKAPPPNFGYPHAQYNPMNPYESKDQNQMTPSVVANEAFKYPFNPLMNQMNSDDSGVTAPSSSTTMPHPYTHPQLYGGFMNASDTPPSTPPIMMRSNLNMATTQYMATPQYMNPNPYSQLYYTPDNNMMRPNPTVMNQSPSMEQRRPQTEPRKRDRRRTTEEDSKMRYEDLDPEKLEKINQMKKSGECPFCGEIIPRYFDLKCHIAEVHEKSKIVCDLCDKNFIRKNEYVRHMRQAHDECRDEPGSVYRRREKEHITRLGGMGPDKEARLRERERERAELNRERAREREQEREKREREEFERDRDNKAEDQEKDKFDKTVVCKYCDRPFSRQYALNRHLDSMVCRNKPLIKDKKLEDGPKNLDAASPEVLNSDLAVQNPQENHSRDNDKDNDKDRDNDMEDAEDDEDDHQDDDDEEEDEEDEDRNDDFDGSKS